VVNANVSGSNELRANLALQLRSMWINPDRQRASTALLGCDFSITDMENTAARLERFAPLLAALFPEIAKSGGRIESELIRVPRLARAILPGDGVGSLWIKADHALPIAGSIKARGGIHEVLEFAETLALENRLIDSAGDYTGLAGATARALFDRYKVAVGSTGNLGMSVGTIAAALGFHAVVHMSSNSKEWKKNRLRARGVQVIEHPGDYETAVDAGRREAEQDPYSYFVDDERSKPLFLGYSVAALRLKDQLQQSGIAVDSSHPLFVYLPCGVGGAPAGITFGLKQIFGDNVHCFFAEPTAAPCFLVRMIHPERAAISVYDIGLDANTEADGLAVPRASELAIDMMRPLLSGVFTVKDDDLFRFLYLLNDTEGIRIEPSAAAGFYGPQILFNSAAGLQYLATNHLTGSMKDANHILWTTGGLFVPDEEYAGFLARGHLLAIDGDATASGT
jgi:D-serine dehydratase